MRQHKSHVTCAFIAAVLGGCSAMDAAMESESSSTSSALSQVPRVMPTTIARVASASGQPAGLSGFSATLGCNANAHLSLQGGTALQAPTISITEIDWGNNLAPETRPLAQTLYYTLDETLVRLPDDPPYVPYSSWMRAEYGSSVLKHGAVFQITPANTQTTITDGDIQVELARQVGLGTITADNAHIYMVHLPSTVSATVSGLTSCVDWCGYHLFTQVNGHNLYYAVIPDFKDTACNSICSENLGAFGWQQQQQATESHEIAETLTDGDLTGWQDPNQPSKTCGKEIGDICNGQSANIVRWDNWDETVTVQKEWSNAAGDCVTGDQTPTIASLLPASGPSAGGQTITVTGSRFAPGNTVFWFGTAKAAVVNCTSPTTCIVTSPAANAAPAPSVTVGVKAIVNGLTSSWDGTQDNYTYTCAPLPCPAGACGSLSDGCGGSVTCSCPLGDVCLGDNRCCAPITAAQACAGKTCGTASDTCSGSYTCGPPCPCTPQTCEQLGVSCGNAGDGCGGIIACGGCSSGFTCASGSCVRKCAAGLVNCDGKCVKPNFCR